MKYEKILCDIFNSAESIADKLRRSGLVDQRFNRGAFGDITYRIDRDIENEIIKKVQQELPDALIITEERGVIGENEGFPLVLIDPVDGSTNAIQNIPFYSSTLAIIEGYSFNEIVAAGVADLVNGERIISTRKGVVTIDKTISHPSKQKILEESYININIRTNSSRKSDWIISLLSKVRYPRFFGSAALETSYVAVGKSNGYIQISPNLRSFDCIGALHLVRESGGWIKFLNLDIEKVDLRKPNRFAYIAACNDILGEKILSLES
jgi:fructose-1,6-bisphosphatase/inositol monophosphatase family enzyme